MSDNIFVHQWQTITRCFVCKIDSTQERLIPATLAIGPDEIPSINHGNRRKTYVCMPCGAHVKTITDAFGR